MDFCVEGGQGHYFMFFQGAKGFGGGKRSNNVPERGEFETMRMSAQFVRFNATVATDVLYGLLQPCEKYSRMYEWKGAYL